MKDECEPAQEYPHSAIHGSLVELHYRLLGDLRALRHEIAGTGEGGCGSGESEPAREPSLRDVLESAPGQISAIADTAQKEIAEIRNLLFG